MSQAHAVSYQRSSFVEANAAKDLPPPNAKAIPLRARRATLPVLIDGPKAGQLLTQLLHSPLGVYVSGTALERGALCVTLDIATEDLDFTLHTLISTLPEATIGALKARHHKRMQ